MMQRFKQFDVALAKFKNYPLWPVKIMQIGKDSHGKPTDLVFCYGNHDELRLIDANLQEYNLKRKIHPRLLSKKQLWNLITTLKFMKLFLILF